ncbi:MULTISPECIES: DUF397 domain-containing protein [unclassified Streptomyces]|uniref:DUF397 domain-containing protein n=1 Tax=unclassified Streptomyces TaxID=2593676 RepID=UPI003811EA7A
MPTTDHVWYKSSYSGGAGSDCVETAIQAHAVRVRDSKNTQGPQLCLSPAAWTVFVTDVAGPRS